MHSRLLGRTGLAVSPLALGTVSLGVPYGIPTPDAKAPGRNDAIELLRAARVAGITLYDTAPNYGTAEVLLGEALGDDLSCVFATKVSLPPLGTAAAELTAMINASVERSRIALRRDRVDLLQIHNRDSDGSVVYKAV
jgi:aryl-alcohol dehydrogenase-like predicted oxidoreductase